MTSLGRKNVRGLSVQLLIDLLTIGDNARAAEIARDMEALSEDLLMAGAYDDTQQVTQALAARATAKPAIGRDACRQALDQLGESLAMRETASIIGDVDEKAWKAIRSIVTTVGPSSIEALRPMVAVEDEGAASTRASETIVGFGKPAISRLAPLVGDSRWFAQRAGAILLGTIGSAEVVPLLQPLLRKSDPRVTQATVAALGKVDDPSAARPSDRAAGGTGPRAAVVHALLSSRPRVVPMLARIVAAGRSARITTSCSKRSKRSRRWARSACHAGRSGGPARWFGGKKLRALKESLWTRVTIGGEKAAAALDEPQDGRPRVEEDRRGETAIALNERMEQKSRRSVRRLAAALRGEAVRAESSTRAARNRRAHRGSHRRAGSASWIVIVHRRRSVVDYPLRRRASLVGLARDRANRTSKSLSRGPAKEEVRSFVSV